MKRYRSILVVILTLALILGLISCSSQTPSTPSSGTNSTSAADTTPDSGENPSPVELVVAASHSAGTMYLWCVTVAELVNKYSEWLTLTPITTLGSTENIELVHVGDAQLGGVPATTFYMAYEGEGGDWVDNAYHELRSVYASVPGYFQIMAPENSDINTIADLEGKRVAFGVRGSGGEDIVKFWFKCLGIDANSFLDINYISASDSVTAIQEGTLDAFVFTGGIGASVGLELAASPVGLKLISLSDEEVALLTANDPADHPQVIPAGSYPGVDYEVNTVGNSAVIVTTADIPDRAIYEMCRIIDEHYDEIADHNATAYSTAEHTVGDWYGSLPMHPGAEQYFRDKGLIP